MSIVLFAMFCCVVMCSGPAKVTELLYTAFLQLQKRNYYRGPSQSVLEALAALPGAADMASSVFCNVLNICTIKKDASKLEPLLQLPCVQGMHSKDLCAAIYDAGKAGFHELVERLCSYVVFHAAQQQPLAYTLALFPVCWNSKWCCKQTRVAAAVWCSISAAFYHSSRAAEYVIAAGLPWPAVLLGPS